MPRLSTKDYQFAHEYLRDLCVEHRPVVGLLRIPQQQDIHAFFVPDKDLDPAQLRAHRKAASAADPSLPQRAGRALKDLDLIMEGKKEPARSKPVTVSGRSVSARALVNPEIDGKRIAQAFWSLAKRTNGRKEAN